MRLFDFSEPNGEELRYVYDAGNRITAIQDKAGAILGTFTYDAVDRLTNMQSPDIATDYQYDAAGRMLGLNYQTFGHALAYVYDKDGLRRSMTLAGDAITYARDAAHRLTAMTAPHGAYGFAYDQVGRQIKRTYFNGVTTTYDYDAKGQLTKIEHRRADGALLAKFHYTYDENGNRASMTDNLGKHSYFYDKLDRLIKAELPYGLTEAYAYDPVGNRTSLTRIRMNRTRPLSPGQPAQTTEVIDYAYDPRDMLLRAGTTGYHFDTAGRLGRIDYPSYSTTFEYDTFDRTKRISGLRHPITGAPLPDSVYQYAPQMPDLRFTPAPLGVRISKTDSEGTTKYVVDNTGNVPLYLNEANAAKTKYLHTENIDDPLAITTDRGHSYTMLLDALNSVAMLADRFGLPVQAYQYVAFGASNVTSRDLNDLGYTAKRSERDTGLQNNAARDLDRSVGRFTIGDPWMYSSGSGFFATAALRAPQRLNRCSYAENNPATYSDPWGLAVTRPPLPGGAFPPFPGQNRQCGLRPASRSKKRRVINEDFEVDANVLISITKMRTHYFQEEEFLEENRDHVFISDQARSELKDPISRILLGVYGIRNALPLLPLTEATILRNFRNLGLKSPGDAEVAASAIQNRHRLATENFRDFEKPAIQATGLKLVIFETGGPRYVPPVP